eukprot:15348495-Ditylum_brightwellii.AAC.1
MKMLCADCSASNPIQLPTLMLDWDSLVCFQENAAKCPIVDIIAITVMKLINYSKSNQTHICQNKRLLCIKQYLGVLLTDILQGKA